MAIRNVIVRMNQGLTPPYSLCLKAKFLFTMPGNEFLAFAQRYAEDELALTRKDFSGNHVESQRLPSPIQIITALELAE